MSPRLDLPFAVLAWFAGFLWLGRSGSWLLLAVLAVACAIRLVIGDPAVRRLLAATPRATIAGVLGAGVMVAGTYVLFGPLCALFPALPGSTAHLYGLLRTGAPSTQSTLALVVVVSAAEEIVWRGRTIAANGSLVHQGLRILAAAAIYGLAHVASGSVTLMAVAFVCGIAWGALRVAARSLWAPIVTHILWDVSVVFVWPLA